MNSELSREINEAAYKNGDQDQHMARYQELSILKPDFVKKFIIDRNLNWLPKMNELISGPGTHFIAVGVLHLFGEQGVIQLLKNEGFTVTRISSSDEYQAKQ